MDKYNGTTINYEENVLFYEIEENDDFDYDALPEEEQKELDNYNAQKDEEFTHTLLDTIFPDNLCRCQVANFLKREMSKAKLITNGQPTPTLRQEDVDQFKFAVTVLTKNGKHDTVSTIVRECKKCHKIEYYGSAEVFTQLLNEATVNFINNSKDPDELQSVDFAQVLQDAGLEMEDIDLENIDDPEDVVDAEAVDVIEEEDEE